MVASKVTKTFVESLSTEDFSEYYSLILPKVCLNRYYVAEGVKCFSQELWKTATIVDNIPVGIDIIVKNANAFIDF